MKKGPVLINSIVGVVDLTTGTKSRYKIVSKPTDVLLFEDVTENIIEEATADSPIGKALLDKKGGDMVVVEAGINRISLQIESVFNGAVRQ
ncbi:MAG: GreA/GreB family elongation factor [Fibrobacterota bacterium]